MRARGEFEGPIVSKKGGKEGGQGFWDNGIEQGSIELTDVKTCEFGIGAFGFVVVGYYRWEGTACFVDLCHLCTTFLALKFGGGLLGKISPNGKL